MHDLHAGGEIDETVIELIPEQAAHQQAERWTDILAARAEEMADGLHQDRVVAFADAVQALAHAIQIGRDEIKGRQCGHAASPSSRFGTPAQPKRRCALASTMRPSSPRVMPREAASAS